VIPSIVKAPIISEAHPIQSIIRTLTLAAKWLEREADSHLHLVSGQVKNTRNKTSAVSCRYTFNTCYLGKQTNELTVLRPYVVHGAETEARIPED
jgi:hypothetical protein